MKDKYQESMRKIGAIVKYIAILFIALILFLSGAFRSSGGKEDISGRITISGAFALYPLAIKWSDEFKKENPNIQFDISAGGAGKGITDVLSNMVDIGLLSRDINPEETKQGAFYLAVAKDAVVPTISSSNPFINKLMTEGIKKEDFINVWITGKYKDWSKVGGGSTNAQIHVYTRSDACGAAETWAKYLGKKQEDLLGVGVFGDPGLAQAVKRDGLGIGFNNLVYVFDSNTKKQTNGVRIVPIDLNGNGKIDPEENFYDDINQVLEAIANGKYPSPPARDLYFVTKGKPQNKIVVKFIEWILTSGQKYVRESGYINLTNEKIKAELEKIGVYDSK